MTNGHISNHLPPAAPEPGSSILSHELEDEHDQVLARLQRIPPESSKDRGSHADEGMLASVLMPSADQESGASLLSCELSSEREALLTRLERILANASDDLRSTLIRGMLAGVATMAEQPPDLLDVKIMSRALKELQHAFRVFQPYEHSLKVSIYGSARTPTYDPNFQLAAWMGRLLSQRGFMVITGAGPGIMEAGHEGAGKDMSFGVNIMLPFEQGANAVIAGDPKLVHLKYFFTRKLLFVRESHAAAFFPGGFGTMDEAFELLTLIQTGKANVVPIVCLQAPGSDYWTRWMDFVKHQLLPGSFISESDLSLLKVFDNAEAAAEEIQHFYRNFHSYRFVKESLVIRMRHSLTPEQLKEVRSGFHDLASNGVIVQGKALAPELDDREALSLPRLILPYHRQDAGRLRQLIDWLNGLPQGSA